MGNLMLLGCGLEVIPWAAPWVVLLHVVTLPVLLYFAKRKARRCQ